MDEKSIIWLKRIYFYAVLEKTDFKKIMDLEKVTGVKADLTKKSWQKLYIKAFSENGLSRVYDLYKISRVLPSEDFFINFFNRYTKIKIKDSINFAGEDYL